MKSKLFPVLVKIFITISIYFVIELVDRAIYMFFAEHYHFGTEWKMLRDTITLMLFLFYSYKTRILVKDDFVISFKPLILAAAVVFLFLYIFTRSDPNQQYTTAQTFRAISFSPIIEELICRKLILSELNESGYLITGIIISTIVFVLLHFNFSLNGIIFFLIMNFILIGLQLKTHHIINNMLLHSFSNLVILTL